ncbi:MAG TPA: serine/threonine protein kinase, partial [Myxococcaceae bacterium]|nr:serine/threonine protein kinase [Myxococcaceae bacterium]
GQPVDQRSDLYSVGIILWELLTNKRLFAGDTEMEIMHRVRDGRAPLIEADNGVPFYASQIVRRALFADRVLRFQNAGEFAKALELLARRSGWPLTVDALKPLLGG